MSSLYGTVTEAMDAEFHKLSAEELIKWANNDFGDELVMSTSFGIQAAVTLHLMTQQRPDIPVIWVDTGYLPEETYAYADTLTERLNLNLKVYRAELEPEQMEAKFGQLWESGKVEDLDLYDWVRKVEPFQRALEELGALGWISGLRAEQTAYRAKLPRVKRVKHRYRMYPILPWTSKDVYQYMQKHDLPQHPLFEKGYTTVGDAHSSRPIDPEDQNERDTRFRGLKQECGLHL